MTTRDNARRPQISVVVMEKSRHENARNLGEESAQNVPGYSGLNMGGGNPRIVYGRGRGNVRVKDTRPLAFGITTGEWNKAASDAMRAHVGDDRHAAKKLADILECSPRTAENYLQGRTAPGGVHFLRAYAAIPEFTAEVRRLSAMESSLDPEFERAAMDFLRVASARLARRPGAEAVGSDDAGLSPASPPASHGEV